MLGIFEEQQKDNEGEVDKNNKKEEETRTRPGRALLAVVSTSDFVLTIMGIHGTEWRRELTRTALLFKICLYFVIYNIYSHICINPMCLS